MNGLRLKFDEKINNIIILEEIKIKKHKNIN
jgi:hypothetical protein